RSVVGLLVVLCAFGFQSLALKLGVVVTQMAAESQARVANTLERLAKENGWEVIVLNSKGSSETQLNQIENLVEMRVDAIILVMGRVHEVRPGLEAAFAAGIPVVTVDSGYIPGIIADITCDNFVLGAKISTYFVDMLGGTGNIIVFRYEKHHGTRKRGKVLDQVLSEYPGIKVLAEYTIVNPAKFIEETRSAMETFILRYGNQINGVWCAFDQLAFAVIDVLQEYGLKNVIVVGVDGLEEAFRRIRAGVMTATAAQPFEDMAAVAIDLIKKIVIDKIEISTVAPRKIIYLDAPIVDQTNVAQFIKQ
ncbi:MAG: sugar ABC transporter substrate-binding protein, partial [Nitrososphaeria archaeon]